MLQQEAMDSIFHGGLTLGLGPSLIDGGEPTFVKQLRNYVQSLEAECMKIEPFRRELPLCINLLNSVIETCKEKLIDRSQNQPSTKKDVMPSSALHLTRNEEDNAEEFQDHGCDRCVNHTATKRSSRLGDLTSTLVQGRISNGIIQNTKFWSASEAYAHAEEIVSAMNGRKLGGEESSSATKCGPKPSSFIDPSSLDRRRGAFVPFSLTKRPASNSSSPADHEERSSTNTNNVDSECLTCTREDSDALTMSRGGPATVSRDHGGPNYHTNHRPISAADANTIIEATFAAADLNKRRKKQRMCWSPELHRKFVSALHRLGGPQLATPKQIRALMGVDSLTNDEVKSHLQKYRLHSRRRRATSRSAVEEPSHDVVVMSRIWLPNHHQGRSNKQSQRSGGNYAGPLPGTSVYLHRINGDMRHVEADGYSSQAESLCCSDEDFEQDFQS